MHASQNTKRIREPKNAFNSGKRFNSGDITHLRNEIFRNYA